MNNLLYLLTIITLLVGINSYHEFVNTHPSEKHTSINIIINGTGHNVCTASTKAEQLVGINNPVCTDGAMFYFEQTQRYIFNMVDVGYPLKLLTLDEQWNVQEVILMQPGQPEIVPEKPFKYALELKDIDAYVKVKDSVVYIDAKAHNT